MGCAKEIVNYLHTINGLAILVVKLKQFLNRKKTIFLSYNSTAPWMQKAITLSIACYGMYTISSRHITTRQ